MVLPVRKIKYYRNWCGYCIFTSWVVQRSTKKSTFVPSSITKLTPNVDSFLPWNGAVYILCKILQTSYLRQQKSRFRKFSLTIKNTSLFISVDKVKKTFKPSTTTKTLPTQTLRHYRMVPCIFSVRSSTTSCLRRQRPILWQISLTIKSALSFAMYWPKWGIHNRLLPSRWTINV